VNASLFSILNLNILAGFGLVLERQRWLRMLPASRNKSILTSAGREQLIDFVHENLIFARASILNISVWRQIMSMKDGNCFSILAIAMWL